MQTPPGPNGLGQTATHNFMQIGAAMGISDQLRFSRFLSENQPAPAATGNAATPRRYTPPSPGANDLTEFFGSPPKEWNGVKITGLAASTTVSDIKTVLLFSVVEDVRIFRSEQIIKGAHQKDAYVRLRDGAHAEQAEALLNRKEFNGTVISVTVVPRPTAAEITKLAGYLETFGSEQSSRSPSSDGLTTPATAISMMNLGEYTTAGSRNIASSVSPNNGHIATNGTVSRGDSGLGNEFLSNGIQATRPSTSDVDIYEMMAGTERLNMNDNNQMASNGLGNNSSAFEGSTLLPGGLFNDNIGQPRRLGTLHQTMEEQHESPADSFGDLTYPRPRRQTNPAQSTSGGRFQSLPPLSTMNMNGVGRSGVASPLTAPPGAAPSLTSPMSPGGWPSSAVNRYTNFPVSHPPANPADQNPPCNTLYVGNLPAQTSEDELKTLFVRQRGYKRMCFRAKPQGPMCFVEFEDTHYATKALTELYGRALSNSTKGGVRLSFSKNPLGVRSNPPNGANAANGRGNGIPGATALPTHGLAPGTIRTPPGLPSRSTSGLSATSGLDAAAAAQPPPGLFGSATQQLREQTSNGNQSSVPPPGLYNTPSLRDQTNAGRTGFLGQIARMPPGISTNTNFYAGTTPDHRTPVENARSPVGDLFSPGPGAIGTR